MKIKQLEIDNKNVFVIEYLDIKENKIEDVSKYFLNTEREVILITKQNKPYYIITQTDIIDALVSHFDNMKVIEYIDKIPKKLLTINENETVFNGYRILRRYKINHIIVTDDNANYKFIINFSDFANYLTEIALKDELTGLYNKRFFQFMKDKYKVEDIEIGFIFMDLDNFKLINDNYGHLIGDKVLKVVSDKIKEVIRDIDYAFRFGGDEFVIMAFTDREGLDKIYNRLKENIDGYKLDDIKIKCSIGFAHFPTDSQDIEEVIKLADNIMYKNKKSRKLRI